MNRIHAIFTSLALIAAGCASTDVPKYSTRVEEGAPGSLAVHLSSNEGMSKDDLRRALLREAARATIDRGGIYLRVDEISDQPSVEMEQRAGTSPTQPSLDPNARTESAELSFGRRRSGTIRITTSRNEIPGNNVFDASALLSRIESGSVPELKP